MHDDDTPDDRDPVCGMTVDLATTSFRAEHAGITYGFCCASCHQRFVADPERFLQPPSTEACCGHGSARDEEIAQQVPAGTRWVCPMDPEIDESEPGACAICGMALEPASLPVQTLWTCPMHPDIEADQPGDCPACGMALEPITVALADAPNPELIDMRRRLIAATALTVPLLLLAMGEMVAPSVFDRIGSARGRAFVQLLLTTPVVFGAGWPFFARALASLRNRSPNMFTLIGLGTATAWGYSTLVTVFPTLFSATRLSAGDLPVDRVQGALAHGLALPVYFEAAATIITLALLGQILELRARGETQSALRALLDLTPKTARRVSANGEERDVLLARVRIGDLLRVRPGEAIPTDATVIEGTSAVDESLMTGESIPVARGAGDPVTGGTLNGEGSLLVRAEAVGSETLLARVVAMVADAQRSRAPIQGLADRVSGYFVPIVVLVAALAFVSWFLWGPVPSLTHAVMAAVSVLIIACPCALGLATPMSIMVGTGRGAQEGVLVKHAEALERLATVDTLVFDKTGTLTEGRPRLQAIRVRDAIPTDTIECDAGERGEHAHSMPTEDDLLRWAASLERGSEHPLARAILSATEALGIEPAPVEQFASHPGQGITGIVEGQHLILGNERLLRTTNARLSAALGSAAAERRAAGETVVFLARGPTADDLGVEGLLAVADPVKPTTREALAALRAQGLHLVMLTGDNAATARAVAQELGIETVHADALPADKAALIAELEARGHRVAMAGDGVNDAPALARASVGIAMATGTDVAIESAGMTLLRGDLRGLVRAFRLSRATLRNIRQNLAFAFLYNVLGVPIAAGLLYPFFGLLLSPMIASAAMTFSSVSVIGNALRLRAASL